MALRDEYPEDFELLWNLYPKWPTGRSKKRPSYLAFASAKRALKFDASDIDAIGRNIQSRLINCETWQTGNKYGPPMFATYMNQRLWNEPHEKKGHYKPTVAAHADFEPTPVHVPANPEVAARALAEAKRMTRH